MTKMMTKDVHHGESANERRVRRLSPAIVVATIAFALAAASFGYAAIPSSSGEITACVSDAAGRLRVIDAEAGETCRDKESLLSWPSRISGAPLAGHQTVSTAALSLVPGEQRRIIASCPAGTKAIAGGFSLGGNAGDVFIYASSPVRHPFGDPDSGWQIFVENTTGAARTALARAVCAEVEE